jgi:carbon storage regulator
MLYLTRKIGEAIIINNSIEISVVEIKGKSVKFGITFPNDVSVLRKEVHDKITEQNLSSKYTSKEELFNIFDTSDTEEDNDSK